MGKENYQAPALEELIRNGINIQYPGNDVDRLARTRDTINFHHHIVSVRRSQQYSDDYLRDICAAFRIYMVEDINQPRHHTFGSRLVGIYDDQLHIVEIKDISAHQRFIYLIKLYHYFLEHPELNTDKINADLIDKTIEKVLHEVKKEVSDVFQCLATQAALGNDLKQLVSLYKNAKGPDAKPNPVRDFLAQMGEAVQHIIETSPELQRESQELGFNRAWRLTIGTYLFIILAIDQEWIMDSELRKICAARVGKIDNYVRHECLATFKSILPLIKGQIESFGKTQYRGNCALIGSIDGSLEKYEDALNKAIRASRGEFNSSFPTLTLALGIIGAIAFSTIGGGLGTAVGMAVTQTDAMVPFLTNGSHVTSKLMHAAVGDMGKNMSYRMTELGVSFILSNGLSKLCSALGGVLGFAGGAIPGAAVDFSVDCINKLRAQAKLDPAFIKNEDMEFLIAMMKLPPRLLAAEKKEWLRYKTQGLFPPQPNAAPVAREPERGLQPGQNI